MSMSEKLGVSKAWGQALASLPPRILPGSQGRAMQAPWWFQRAEGGGAVRTLKQAVSPGERALRLTMGEGRQSLALMTQ